MKVLSSRPINIYGPHVARVSQDNHCKHPILSNTELIQRRRRWPMSRGSSSVLCWIIAIARAVSRLRQKRGYRRTIWKYGGLGACLPGNFEKQGIFGKCRGVTYTQKNPWIRPWLQCHLVKRSICVSHTTWSLSWICANRRLGAKGSYLPLWRVSDRIL